jgi:hypothetical protein
MRWRKASPNSPPEAKLSRTLRREEWSLAFSRGMQKRIKKGAALMIAVEMKA